MWNSEDIARICNGKAHSFWVGKRIVFSSLDVMEGDIFIALKGEKEDGHKYIEDAFTRGAAAVIVSSENNVLKDKNYVLVDDTLEALKALACYRRENLNAKFIGITGSVGKTTTREIFKLAFASAGKTDGSIKSYNNFVGLPITLANLEEDTKYAILEMGMNHKGEMADLARVACPNIGVVTNIEPAHTEFFPEGVQGVASAKGEMFDFIPKYGHVILNADSNCFDYLKNLAASKSLNIVAVGKNKEVDLISYTEKDGKSYIEASVFDKRVKYTMNSYGIHIAINSLFALAALYLCGCDVQKGADNLAVFKNLGGRGEIKKIEIAGKAFTLIDDAYNASPCAMEIALKNLATRKKRKLAIIADMRELGEKAVEYHQNIAKYIDPNIYIITYGTHMKALYEILPKNQKLAHFDALDDLIHNAEEYIEEGDFVLVKGSLGTKVHKLVEHFIKREEHVL